MPGRHVHEQAFDITLYDRLQVLGYGIEVPVLYIRLSRLSAMPRFLREQFERATTILCFNKQFKRFQHHLRESHQRSPFGLATHCLNCAYCSSESACNACASVSADATSSVVFSRYSGISILAWKMRSVSLYLRTVWTNTPCWYTDSSPPSCPRR